MNRWRPISSAPKDGTEVLVWYDFATVPIVHIAFYRSGKVIAELIEFGLSFEPNEVGWWSYIENSMTQHQLTKYNTPTHWMPLPPAPEGPNG